jgi:predicted HAD superfamily Cof-like phosphohydrolase
MESKVMDLVKAMHQKFGLENTTGPNHLSKEEKEFRSDAMLEELNEYIAADTLVDQYDALLDLIVFAVGTLERHGFPLLAGFEKVMEANMTKELGQNGEKRGGFKRDLVKPEGWTAPEAKLQLILDGNTNPQVEFSFAPSSDGKIVAGFAPKFDATKVRLDLLPIDPMMQIANVFGFGAKKYFANSYRQGETVVWSRTYGSIMRHMMAFWSGEDKDPESGLDHLAHAGTQLFILMEHTAHNKNKDDRFVRSIS